MLNIRHLQMQAATEAQIETAKAVYCDLENHYNLKVFVTYYAVRIYVDAHGYLDILKDGSIRNQIILLFRSKVESYLFRAKLKDLANPKTAMLST